MRPIRWTLALLLGAALGTVPFGLPTADASVTLVRTDIALAAAPESVAIGDLDGRNGKDILVALPASGSVGVLLNNGERDVRPDADRTLPARPVPVSRWTSRSVT